MIGFCKQKARNKVNTYNKCYSSLKTFEENLYTYPKVLPNNPNIALLRTLVRTLRDLPILDDYFNIISSIKTRNVILSTELNKHTNYRNINSMRLKI